MRDKKRTELEPGDQVVVVDPLQRTRRIRATLVALRKGGRLAEVQDPYEWGTRTVPSDYVVPDWRAR